MNIKQESYIPVKEAAKILKVTIQTAKKYCKKGYLTCKKFPETPKGRIYVNELDIPTFLRK